MKAIWIVGAASVCLFGGSLYADQTSTPETGPPSLHGQVLGDEGRPLVGAVVRFRLARSDDDRATEQSEIHVVRTGEGGGFSTEQTNGQRYDVRVHAEGYAFWTERDVDPARPVSARLVRGLPLTGRVLAEATGHGISGATVRVDDDETFELGGVELETSTDKNGRYTFSDLPPGTVWIRATARGHATRSIRTHLHAARDDAAPATPDDVWLPEGGRISGRVVDAEDDPISDAKVLINPVDGFIGGHRNRFPVTTTRSDEDGLFSLDGVTAGTRYMVLARSEGHAPGSVGPLRVEAGDELDDVTVTLQTGAVLRLRLVDPEDDPVTDLTIHLYSEDAASSDRTAQHQAVATEKGEIESDEEGFLTAGRLRPGTYTVSLEPRDWMGLERQGVTLVQSETTDLGTIRLDRGSTVTGRVVDGQDEPIGDAEIVVRWRDLRGDHSRSTASAGDGAFRVAGLPHVVALTATAPGFAERKLERISVDGETVAVKLSRQGSIAGRVTLGDDGVPPVFSARAVPDRSDDKPSTRRDGWNGSFEIDRLDPGTYTVLIRAPGNWNAHLDEVRVRAGATVDAGEIVLARGLRLEGRIVRNDNGGGCAGAAVRLDRGAGPGSWSGESGDAVTVSDVRGSFSLDGLAAGRYTLTVDHPEFAPLQQSVDLKAGEDSTNLEFGLGVGGEIRGTVVDAEGLPLSGVDVYVIRGTRGFDRRIVATHDDGSFSVSRVAPGSYVVIRGQSRARSGFNSQIRTVEVRDGEATVVKFQE